MSSASTKGALSAIYFGLIVLIFLSLAAIVLFFVYRLKKYNIECMIQTLRHGRYINSRDRLGIFKKKGIYYAKLWKRRLQIEMPNFEAIIKSRGYPDTLYLRQVGVGSFYQIMFPESPKDVKEKAIDHNILRLSSMQLREDNSIYSSQDDWLDKYGIYIAWLFMIIVFAISQYILFSRLGTLLNNIKALIDNTKEYQSAVIKTATIFIPITFKNFWRKL